MRIKTQTFAIAISFAIASIQFVSCKKDDAAFNQLSQSANSNAVADSTSDSSLLKGLVAWYPFNGDILDHSGHNNNIILNSAKPVKGKTGLNKTAYLFDGISSYMQVANNSSLNPSKISIYALVKVGGFYAGQCHQNRIVSKGYNDTYTGRIDLGFSDLYYYHYNGCDEPIKKNYENFFGSFGDGSFAAGATDTNNTIKTGVWYSVVYTYDGSISKLYLNGVLVNKVYGTTSFNANSNDLFIGRNEDVNYPYYFKGAIDEVRIYSKVLTAKQVLQLYNQN